MYKQKLKVHNEDLYDGKESKMVKVNGNMGGLKVSAYIINDAETLEDSSIEVYGYAYNRESDNDFSWGQSFPVGVATTPVKAGQYIGGLMIPDFHTDEDSETTSVDFVNARVDGDSTNIRVTLEYLPR